MTDQPFKCLASDVVRGVTLVQRGRGQWEAWVCHEPTPEEACGEPLRTDAGAVQRWSDLGRAYAHVRACGYAGTVEVEDGEPIGALVVEPTGAGEWRWAVVLGGAEIARGEGYDRAEAARADGEAELTSQGRPAAIIV